MPIADHHLIDRLHLPLPALPAAARGLRIAHITDLHVTGPRRRYRQVAAAVAGLEVDLALYTGDYMSDPGQEPAAMEVLRDLTGQLRPRLGSFGVFGNHDSRTLRTMARELPIRWLHNDVALLADGAIQLIGFENEKHRWPDTLELVERMAAAGVRGRADAATAESSAAADLAENVDQPPRPLRLLLSHYPNLLPVASDLGVDIVFSGHTHGGQWRLPGRIALYTSCDLPGHLAAGVHRHRDTLGIVSRGLGETFVHLRFFSAPHVPVIELVNGPLPGERTDGWMSVQGW